ncbi:MAG: chemotaxis response regulator protein-glutamate methylesterase [Bdellovibrionota bacterium]|nr:chemotaxis response regulator protein-glutamate methylesterase [Bdellovibrionota bacterium]
MKFSVLVVDDSALMRKKITEILEKDPELKVVAKARNGVEALDMIEKHNPDVISLDINMPEMDGLTLLANMQSKYDIPVVMVSSLTQEGAVTTFEALELGAVDFVPKPGGTISRNINEVEDLIRTKVKAATKARVALLKKKPALVAKKRSASPKRVRTNIDKNIHRVVLIATSTGGPKTIFDILPYLPSEFNFSLVVVQHIPGAFSSGLASRINSSCSFEFKLAEEGEELVPGVGYLAPGGKHLTVHKNSKSAPRFRLSSYPKDTMFTPAADVTFTSFAKALRNRCIGVVLTGMGDDGSIGVEWIKECGGKTLAESEETSIVFGMPKAAIDTGCVDEVCSSYEMCDKILEFAGYEEGVSNGKVG